MVFATETAPAASIYATRTAVRAALAGMQPSEADAADAGDAVLVTIRNLAFETNRDGLAEHLRLATGLSFDREPRRVELVTSSNTGRNVGRARVSVPSRAEAEVVVQKVDGTELDGRTLSLRFADPKLDDAIVTIRNLPPETRIGDVTRHVKRVTERGSVGRIVFKKKDQSVDVAFRSRAGAEAAALQLDGTELAGRTLSARVSPRKTRSVSPRPAAPPAPPSSDGSPRAGARSREAVVAALASWVALWPDRAHSDHLDAFYRDHPHLGRKPKGFAWLTADLLAAQGLQRRPDQRGGFFLEELDDDAAAAWAARAPIQAAEPATAWGAAPIEAPASDGATAILALVARADALRPRLERRDEDIRARVQSVLQKAVSFRRCAVGVFGSATSGLRTSDTADLDLCVLDPAIEKKASAYRALLSEARELDGNGDLFERGTRLKKARRALEVAMREKEREAQMVVDMTAAGTSIEKVQLHEDKWRSVCEEIPRLEEVLREAEANNTPIIDRVMELREQADDKKFKNAGCVYPIKSALERARGFGEFKVVRHARVPLVKCVYTQRPLSEIALDIVPGNAVAHANSRLLKAYGDKAPAFRALVLVVKSWAKSRGLNDASEGYLSSYAHALTCLHFCLVKGLWPRDFHDAPVNMVEDIDVSWQEVGWSPPKQPSFELVRSYFEYMNSVIHDDGAYCLCCRARPTASRDDGDRGAYLISKDRWTFKNEDSRRQCLGRLSIEDPFRTFDSRGPHDPAATLERGGLEKLKAGYTAAVALLGDDSKEERQRVAELAAMDLDERSMWAARKEANIAAMAAGRAPPPPPPPRRSRRAGR